MKMKYLLLFRVQFSISTFPVSVQYIVVNRERFRSAVKGISHKLLSHEMMLVNSIEVQDKENI